MNLQQGKIIAPIIGSPLRALQEPNMNIPKPPMGNQKCKTALFHLKSHFAWRKYATKCLCENCKRKSCRAFIGLTIRAKILLVGNAFLNVNFVLSKLLLGAAAVLSRIATNALYASQLLQWNIKLVIMLINWINWRVSMHYMIAD